MEEEVRPHIFEVPTQDLWATYEYIEDGKVVNSYKVPFTQEELQAIMRAEAARNQPDFIKGYANGYPEREYRLALWIPTSHILEDRARSIAIIQRTVQNADEILLNGKFSPSLNAREAIVEVREALTIFFPKQKHTEA